VKELLLSYAKQLHFNSDILENIESVKSENPFEIICEVFKAEVELKRINKINASIKQAKFDVFKTFEGYKWDGIQIPNSITSDDIMNSEFIDNKENLILYGNVGTGKTHMAIAAGISACNNGKKVKFYRAATLVNELVGANKQGCLLKLMKQIEKCDLLICDEWGYVPVDSNGAKLLFQVIADCYERKSLIITTNLEFGKWNGIFYDEKLTAAIIDRVIHHSHLLVFDRPSYRAEYSMLKNKLK